MNKKTIKVDGCILQVAQWEKCKSVKSLEKALKKVGIDLDPQKVWDELQRVKGE